MRLHNQLERLVTLLVDRFVDSIDPETYPDFCGCSRCRLDVACYVLNRMPSRYVVSERGFTHGELAEDEQLAADIIAHVSTGVARISKAKRPNHRSFGIDCPQSMFRFLFPVITGTILDGNSFSPITEAEIELRIDGTIATMNDVYWQNPLELPGQTDGRYSFWPAAGSATSAGDRTVFDLELLVRSDELEEIRHFFQLELTASAAEESGPLRSHEIAPLYLFRRSWVGRRYQKNSV